MQAKDVIGAKKEELNPSDRSRKERNQLFQNGNDDF